MKDHILDKITHFFLASSNFNGILLCNLAEMVKRPWPDTQHHVAKLLQDEKNYVEL